MQSILKWWKKSYIRFASSKFSFLPKSSESKYIVGEWKGIESSLGFNKLESTISFWQNYYIKVICLNGNCSSPGMLLLIQIIIFQFKYIFLQICSKSNYNPFLANWFSFDFVATLSNVLFVTLALSPLD